MTGRRAHRSHDCGALVAAATRPRLSWFPWCRFSPEPHPARARQRGDAAAAASGHMSAAACETLAPLSMESRQRLQQSEGGPSPESAELAERRREARGCLQTLSRHSYWFDLWIFLLFDLVLLGFVFLLP